MHTEIDEPNAPLSLEEPGEEVADGLLVSRVRKARDVDAAREEKRQDRRRKTNEPKKKRAAVGTAQENEDSRAGQRENILKDFTRKRDGPVIIR